LSVFVALPRRARKRHDETNAADQPKPLSGSDGWRVASDDPRAFLYLFFTGFQFCGGKGFGLPEPTPAPPRRGAWKAERGRHDGLATGLESPVNRQSGGLPYEAKSFTVSLPNLAVFSRR
jgi:hypothetical protein